MLEYLLIIYLLFSTTEFRTTKRYARTTGNRNDSPANKNIVDLSTEMTHFLQKINTYVPQISESTDYRLKISLVKLSDKIVQDFKAILRTGGNEVEDIKNIFFEAFDLFLYNLVRRKSIHDIFTEANKIYPVFQEFKSKLNFELENSNFLKNALKNFKSSIIEIVENVPGEISERLSAEIGKSIIDEMNNFFISISNNEHFLDSSPIQYTIQRTTPRFTTWHPKISTTFRDTTRRNRFTTWYPTTSTKFRDTTRKNRFTTWHPTTTTTYRDTTRKNRFTTWHPTTRNPITTFRHTTTTNQFRNTLETRSTHHFLPNDSHLTIEIISISLKVYFTKVITISQTSRDVENIQLITSITKFFDNVRNSFNRGIVRNDQIVNVRNILFTNLDMFVSDLLKMENIPTVVMEAIKIDKLFVDFKQKFNTDLQNSDFFQTLLSDFKFSLLGIFESSDGSLSERFNHGISFIEEITKLFDSIGKNQNFFVTTPATANSTRTTWTTNVFFAQRKNSSDASKVNSAYGLIIILSLLFVWLD